METITSGGSFKLKGFVLWFLFLFSCHDPQFLEEAVRFSKSFFLFVLWGTMLIGGWQVLKNCFIIRNSRRSPLPFFENRKKVP